MMIIWCMVPEKWRNGVPQTDFFVISDYFLPFYPPNNIKIEQMKKMPGNIISLKCTIKDKHMMYDSWDMNRDRECFAILCYFLPFYSPNNPKKQNEKKKEKNTRRYYHLTIVYQKSWSYAILLLKYGA